MRFSPTLPHYWHVGGDVIGRTGTGTGVYVSGPEILHRSLVIQAALLPAGMGRAYLDKVCADLSAAIAEQALWMRAARVAA